MIDTKVYLRSLNDAADCLDDIADREVARAHYRLYIKQLSTGLQNSFIVLDKEGGLAAAKSSETINTFRIMAFSRDVVNRYGLSSESIKDAKDLDNRLDRAIKGLEMEVGLK